MPIPNDCSYIAPSQLPAIAAVLSLWPQIFQVPLTADWTCPTKVSFDFIWLFGWITPIITQGKTPKSLICLSWIISVSQVLPQQATEKSLYQFSIHKYCVKDTQTPTVFWITMPRHFKKRNLSLQSHPILVNSSAEANWGTLCTRPLPFISDCGVWLDLKPPRKTCRTPSELSALSLCYLACCNETTADPRLRFQVGLLPLPGNCFIPKLLASLLSSFLLLTAPWLYSSTVHILLSVSAAFTLEHLCFDFTHHHWSAGIFPFSDH